MTRSFKFALLAAMVVVICLSATLGYCARSHASHQPLSNTIVIIDPGHGGVDPGAHGVLREPNGSRVAVYEAPYVYDTAVRLSKLIAAKGGKFLLTRHDQQLHGPIQDPANKILVFATNHDTYTLGGGRVRARTIGMLPRIAVARYARHLYPHSKILFVSIHFDIETDPTMSGVHVIAAPGHEPFAQIIAREFAKYKRLRTFKGATYLPVTVSGDKSHGIRNLFILNGKNNPIRDRALVELGNFGNPHDLYSLRDPNVRQKFAQIISDSLIAYAKKAT